MKKLPITKFGNPILRKKAKRVTKKKLQDPKLQELIKRMFYTIRGIGVGLAAPQVEESLRLIVVNIPPSERLKGEDPVNKMVLINPSIVHCSKKKAQSWEGCLSLPSIIGLVPRHQSVTVEWMDEKGEKHVREFKGFPAFVVQHEIDHLQGILYVDRMTDMTTLMELDEFVKWHVKKKR